MYLAFIDRDLVDTLAAQMKALNSPFYNGVDNPIAQELASHVNSAFPLNTTPDTDLPNTGADASDTSGASIDNGKQRQDAIIGVVSALGGIAALVLGFLIVRSVKRKRELLHRRLSDPPDMSGYRPEGRDFDQDSMGAPRRRSFYFAEDSLRGYEEAQNAAAADARTSPVAGMSQRRPIAAGAISAPVLRESSMNW